MPTLLFTVAPPGVAHFHDFLTCLAKFDEDVAIEATPQSVSCWRAEESISILIGEATFIKLEHFEDCTCGVYSGFFLFHQIPLLCWAQACFRVCFAKAMVVQASESRKTRAKYFLHISNWSRHCCPSSSAGRAIVIKKAAWRRATAN